MTRSSPDALGANLLIFVRQTDQKASRSVVVGVGVDARDLIAMNTQKRKIRHSAGGKSKAGKKRTVTIDSRSPRRLLPGQRNASPHSKTQKKSDLIRTEGQTIFQPARAETPFRKAERPYAHHVSFS